MTMAHLQYGSWAAYDGIWHTKNANDMHMDCASIYFSLCVLNQFPI